MLFILPSFFVGKRQNQRNMQAARKLLTYAAQSTGKIHPFNQMAITFEPMVQFYVLQELERPTMCDIFFFL